jgi:AcrR family transcriptional regulator
MAARDRVPAPAQRDEPAKIVRGPRGAPATARGLATRRRILDAAEAVFGERGYHDASVSEITARAGVAQGTFYIYFDSKLQIFFELVEDVGERLRAAMSAASAGALDRIDAERRGFVAFFDFVAQHRSIYHILHEAERVAPQAAYAYYQRISAPYARALRGAMDSGTVWRTNPEALAHALMGIGHFVAQRWLIWPRDGVEGATPEGLPDAVVNAVLDFISHGLTPSHEE